VKKNGGSQYLSHLFNQATVASEAIREQGFRDMLNTKLNEVNLTPIFDNDFAPHDYTVVLGIISKKYDTDGRPKIPFFSKVAIKYAKKNIENLYYNFKIVGIRNVRTNQRQSTQEDNN
jgi:uncharacterized protein (TIGR04141 family)